MNGLIIKPQYADMILSGEKTWELRSRRTNIRGDIAIIKSGTGEIYGIAKLVDVLGQFTADELDDYTDYTGINGIKLVFSALNYTYAYAWVLDNIRPLRKPKVYQHPAGAVTWVCLPDDYLTHKHTISVTDYYASRQGADA